MSAAAPRGPDVGTGTHPCPPTTTGRVVWITGLSGAGKSTVARELLSLLRKDGQWCISLDGDELRPVFGQVTLRSEDYERPARLALGSGYARLARLIAQQGATAVVTTISLFKELHVWNRKNLPGYFEVYLKVPVEELRRRDPKGIYRRFESGELRNVAGLDQPADEPQSPDLLVEFSPDEPPRLIAARVMQRLQDTDPACR
jgi:adenylylsulfate kinase-like enzyme